MPIVHPIAEGRAGLDQLLRESMTTTRLGCRVVHRRGSWRGAVVRSSSCRTGLWPSRFLWVEFHSRMAFGNSDASDRVPPDREARVWAAGPSEEVICPGAGVWARWPPEAAWATSHGGLGPRRRIGREPRRRGVPVLRQSKVGSRMPNLRPISSSAVPVSAYRGATAIRSLLSGLQSMAPGPRWDQEGARRPSIRVRCQGPCAMPPRPSCSRTVYSAQSTVVYQ